MLHFTANIIRTNIIRKHLSLGFLTLGGLETDCEEAKTTTPVKLT
jgi:hypothetical protein